MPLATMWLDHRDIMLSGLNQALKDKHGLILSSMAAKTDFMEAESGGPVPRGWGQNGGGEEGAG